MPDKVCRCGQVLIMAMTEAGNLTPVNAEPDDAGRVALWKDAIGGWQCRIITKSRPRVRGERLHVSHYVTCPFADEFRKDKPKTPRRGAGPDRTYAGRAAALGQESLF
jgi:hypothetical protein